MRYTSTAAALAACVLALTACGGGGDQAGSGERAIPLAATPSDAAMTVKLSVLSSAPEFVSGGDARIHVRAAPGLRDKLVLLVNGEPVDITLKEVADGLEGVVSGLRNGSNLLQVKHGNVRDSITLTNWPITGPMFTGPQQTPFVCTTNQGAVNRQPLVDTPTAPGYKVTDAAGKIVGYSRNCSIETFVGYSYRTTSGGLSAPVEAEPVRQLFLMQRKTSKLGAGLGKTSGWVHRATLSRNGVVMMAGVTYRRIDDQGLHITVGGEERLIAVDNVVICAGQDSLTELMPPEGTSGGPRFYKIGGAALAAELDAKRAIREGAELAARL